MKGFFKPEQITAPRPKRSKKKVGCKYCPLAKASCFSPMMEMSGGGAKDILIIAEAPGEEEDKKGEQLVGPIGQFLRDKMKRYGLDLHKDCYKINAVNCRPPKNRTPTQKEIDCCRSRVWDVIHKTHPKAIFLFGGPAVESFLQHRWTGESLGKISKWRGWKIPDNDVPCWVFPMFHPSYVRRMEGTTVESTFNLDLKTAVDIALNGPSITSDPPPKIRCIRNADEAAVALKTIANTATVGYVAIDFETTGLKPHREGHQIVCVGVAPNPNEAVVVLPNSLKVRRYLKALLANKAVKKVIQNMKFEIAWSSEVLGVQPEGVIWDTMLASHVLDNRPYVTGLKFQTYVHFGVTGYDKEIYPFLKGTEPRNANSKNTILQADIEKVMEYCGMDCVFTYQLASIQMGRMEKLKSWQQRDEDVRKLDRKNG